MQSVPCFVDSVKGLYIPELCSLTSYFANWYRRRQSWEIFAKRNQRSEIPHVFTGLLDGPLSGVVGGGDSLDSML